MAKERIEKTASGSKSDVERLVMFPCPSFSKEGFFCILFSVRDKAGLKCRDEACKIRLPLET